MTTRSKREKHPGGRPPAGGGGRGATVAFAIDPATAAALRAVSKLRLDVQADLVRRGIRRELAALVRKLEKPDAEALRTIATRELDAVLERAGKVARTDFGQREKEAREELELLLSGPGERART
jgi:putative heme iron utilization protein